jgi:lipopolysaccharide/colanic/teichoic acid biosynthesis glycosyltransferase
VRQKFILLGIDLFWVAISPILALLIRDSFAPRPESILAGVEYAGIGILVGLFVLPLTGVNRTLWRYTAPRDLVRLVIAVTAIVLLTLLISFATRRLEDVSRSLPLLQWILLMSLMMGTRLAIRARDERRQAGARHAAFPGGETRNVLLVGVNSVAELYLRSIAEFAPGRISVAGLLAAGAELPGRLLRSHEVLGPPEGVREIVRQLEIHGVRLDCVIVTEPATKLSPEALDALLELERSSNVEVDWMPDLLGFYPTGQKQDDASSTSSPAEPAKVPQAQRFKFDVPADISFGRYARVKRLVDLLCAVSLLVVMAPLFGLVGLLTALDVGMPIVFWQYRPGCRGRFFRLYKFRTMRGAHDREGNRIPDEIRFSKIGEWLRRTRLDELPQLYNILLGEMSFVGPRPLLPIDHAAGGEGRLLVRPGLSGWAQVNGGRLLSPEDKAALDIHYVNNVSLALDVEIVLRSFVVLITGERIRWEAVLSAREALARNTSQSAAAIAEPRRVLPDEAISAATRSAI